MSVCLMRRALKPYEALSWHVPVRRLHRWHRGGRLALRCCAWLSEIETSPDGWGGVFVSGPPFPAKGTAGLGAGTVAGRSGADSGEAPRGLRPTSTGAMTDAGRGERPRGLHAPRGAISTAERGGWMRRGPVVRNDGALAEVPISRSREVVNLASGVNSW